MISDGLPDAPWLHMGASAGAHKSVEGGGRHAIRPREGRLWQHGWQTNRRDDAVAREQPRRADDDEKERD